MNKSKRKVVRVLFFSVFLLTSCMAFKDTTLNKQASITNENYTDINGIYSNLPLDTVLVSYQQVAGPPYYPSPLWENTYGYLSNKRLADTTAKKVKVEIIRHNRIRLTLLKNGEIEKERIIRGRIRDGYFYGRQHFILIPFIPIVFGYNSYRCRIGKTGNDLLIDFKWNYWAFAIIAGGNGKGQSGTTYKKF